MIYNRQKYFVLLSQAGNPIPDLINYSARLNAAKLEAENHTQISTKILLETKTGYDVLYPDIIVDPVFLVSKEAMQVISLYEKDISFLFVVLLDREKEESVSYFCPILKEMQVECDDALYRIKSKAGVEIRIRLDLAESLLGRGAIGMELKEI